MKKIITLLIITIFLLPACVKKSRVIKNDSNRIADKDILLLPYEKRLLLEEKNKIETTTKKNIINDKYELDFKVKNKTGQTIYVTCFSYINKRYFDRWRWDKSPIYEIKNNETATIDIDTIPDKEFRENIYGALGVFKTAQEAEESTYELLKEKNRLDLDLLYKLKNKTVKIGVERYGFKRKILDLEITGAEQDEKSNKELDFLLENKTGKDLWVCCFVYQKKKDMPVWRYDKTEVKFLKNNQATVIDIDTITEKYNKVFTSGFLGVFRDKEEQKAKDSTYELLKPENKIALGKLAALKNKKVVLEIEQYGIKNDFIEISLKPIKRIFK